MVIIAVAVAGALVAAALMVAVVVIDTTRAGFLLQTQTMLTDGPWTPAVDAECPQGVAPSPLEFRPDGALADELPLFPGELIAIRIDVMPDEAPIPDLVEFGASWPINVVEASGPTCAFVVDDGASAARLEWRPTDDGEAAFRIENPRPWVPTTVEVWLTAAKPEGGAALGTVLTADETAGGSVEDSLGGRVIVAERVGAAAQVELLGDPELLDGEVVVRAQVRPSILANPAFDVTVRLEAGENVTLTPIEDADGQCAGDDSIRCDLGDLEAGEVFELAAVVRLADGWNPLITDDCNNTGGIIESGLCISAQSNAFGTSPMRDRQFVTSPDPDLGPLNVRLQRSPAIVRSDREVQTVLVASVADADVGSVEVTGSDCLEVERVPNQRDDGDAFLEVDENWWFACTLDPTRRFLRFDLIAVTVTGERLTATQQGPVTVISPALAVDVEPDEQAGALVSVSNVGDTPVSDVSVSASGCRRAAADGVESDFLEPGATLALECTEAAGIVRAYGLDVSDRPVVAIWPLTDT